MQTMTRNINAIRYLTLLAAALFAQGARAATPLQFWNTSSRAFTGVYLSPAGSGKWGLNQTANDSDGAVAADERLKLSDVTAGRYDVRLVDRKGRACVIKGVDLQAEGHYAFAVSDSDLRRCQ